MRLASRDALRHHRAACFLVVTYAVSWAAWLPPALAHHRAGPGLDARFLLGFLGPLAGALVTVALTERRRGLRRLVRRACRVRVGLRWWTVALGLPLVVYAATYVVLAAYSLFLMAPLHLPTWASLGRLAGFPAGSTAALLVWLFVIVGVGEETGWRAYLQPELQRRLSPLVASLVVAACWAPWCVPALLVARGGHARPLAWLPVLLLAVASASIVLGWLANRTRGSVLVLAALHALLALTIAAGGALAATELAALVIVAAVLVVLELRPIRSRAAWAGAGRGSNAAASRGRSSRRATYTGRRSR